MANISLPETRMFPLKVKERGSSLTYFLLNMIKMNPDGNYQDMIDHLQFRGKMSEPYLPDNDGVLVELASSWPFHDEPKQKKPKPVWFIDLGTETVGQADSIEGARKIRKLFPGSFIRLYEPSLKEIQEAEAKIREEKRYQRGW